MKELLRGINIYLIGMMGAGKTTVGKLLAQRLGYRFLDTDSLIETITGKTINQIFREEGESGFRELENRVLQEVSAYVRTVVATGGGIILRRDNWSHLRDGMVIWLDVPIPLLVTRLRGDTTRPLLQQEKDLKDRLTQLYQQRVSLYQQADITIEVLAEETPPQIVERILMAIPEKIKPPREI
ncbi:MAG: shikimate kinase [Geminocystis sp.]|nr:shikimate kinase [Geminocystis sp.]HIK37681.1 shikimate kinase [Geminocystis sp. M7585_C2015_104]MCS7148819.1 shikimate kinase [Geminocystis sp.]MCX8078453.1 shikimate kinase [Geminocystis sp.]MDW8115343.1 shikimate kinase [Geminocystis sp.]